MVAIVEDHPHGFVLAWQPFGRKQYRDGLRWITETTWALKHLGWGRPSGRMISNATAYRMMTEGKFNGENLYHPALMTPCDRMSKKFR